MEVNFKLAGLNLQVHGNIVSKKANIKRSFPDGPKKVTAVFVDCIPKKVQMLVYAYLSLELIYSSLFYLKL